MHPALVFVVVAWGLNFSVLKLLYRDLTPAATGLARYVLMVVCLVAVCLGLRRPLRYGPGEAWRFNVAGFLGSGLYMVLFLEGMKGAPAALGAIALATVPILTMLMGAAVGQERLTARLIVGSLTGFAGVAVAVLGRGTGLSGELTGTLTVLASAVVWSVSVVAMRPLVATRDPMAAFTLSLPGAALVLVPYGWGAVAETDWGAVSSVGWLSLAYLVSVAGVGAFTAYYRGLSDVGPARATMVQYFVPPTAAFFAWLLLGQPLRFTEGVGLLIAIAGVALATWPTKAAALPPGEAAP